MKTILQYRKVIEMAKLSKLESELFSKYFDDGLLDIFIGLAVALIGVLWIIELVALGAMVPVLLMPFWNPLRQRIIEPRSGVIAFKVERKAATKSAFTKWLLFGLVLLITEIAILVIPATDGLLDSSLVTLLIPALPAMLIAIPLTLVAIYFKIGRFSFYGTIAVFFGLLATYDIGMEPGHTLLLTGVFILLFGTLRFLIFVRDHKPDEIRE